MNQRREHEAMQHVARWVRLLRGEGTAGLMKRLLDYNWKQSAPTGLRYGYGAKKGRGAHSRNTLVTVPDISLFEVWVREHRPTLVQYFEHADAIRCLGTSSKWSPILPRGTEVSFVGKAVFNGRITITVNGKPVMEIK